MKKIFSIFTMAMLLFSCSSEDLGNVEGTEQEVMISVEVPEQIQARGMGGESSALGGATNTGNAMEFNVAVYYEGETTPAWVGTKTAEAGSKKVTFNPIMVLGKSYKVVAYASSTPQNWEANGVQKVNLSDVLNNEDEDAYSHLSTMVAASNMEVKLTRPYGKLRIVTEDYETAITKHFKSEIKNIKITYNTEIPTVFDPVTNQFESTTTQTVFADEAFGNFNYKDESGEKKTLLVDYIPESGNGAILTFTVDVEFANGYTFSREFKQDVPVRRNYLTTLRGNFFLSEAEMDVYYDEVFDGDDLGHNFDIFKAFEDGGEYTLEEDVEINNTLILAEGKSLVLNLNGKKLTVNTESVELEKGDAIIAYGNLVINGEGGSVTGNTRAVWARGHNSKVTINGGTYVGATKAATEVIYASGNGVIDINAGTFEAKTLDNVSFVSPQYAVLNIHNNGAAGCDINVYGGTFVNFDPANNVSENPTAGFHNGNFVAEGYKSVQVDANTYQVMPENSEYVTPASDLKGIIENATAELNIVLAPGTYTYSQINVPNAYPVTIQGGEGVVFDGQFNMGSGNLTLKDLTITNANATTSGISKAANNAVFVQGEGVITAENCVFNIAKATAITSWWSSASTNPSAKWNNVIVKGCTFNCNGNRPLQIEGNATIEGCTFNDPYRYAAQLTAGNTASETVVINFNNNTIEQSKTSGKPTYGLQLTCDYGNSNLIINGSGNTIVDRDSEDALYVWEAGTGASNGKVNLSTITFNTADGKLYLAEGDLATALTQTTEINLLAGTEYIIPAKITAITGSKVTITGINKDAVISFNSTPGGADGGLNSYADNTDLVFKNITVNSPKTTSSYTGGFGRAKSITFENCAYNGQYRSMGPTTFTDCVIDPKTSYIYTDYVNVDFVGCTFNCSEGKGIQVYNDGSTTNTIVNVENCTFTAAKQAQTWDGKPVTAIDINSNGEIFTVNINNTTATGFATGLYSGNNLWNIKGGADYITVNVDGVKVD